MRDPGHVVVVTGASSGIGRATVHVLARRGYRLVLAARSEENLEKVRAECEELGAEAVVVPTDVSDGDSVDALFRTAVSRFGTVDGVVHSAAVLAYGRFVDIPARVFDQVLSTNVQGTANVARAALGVFEEQAGGRLVVVGSVIGQIAVPLMSTYVTSKWAMAGLVRTLQIEARRLPGVDVTLVSPGGVNTPIYQLAGNYAGFASRPPPPVDPPEKVARAVVRGLDRPRRSISVGPANPMMVFGFRSLPGVYDRIVTPMMERAGLSREPVHPSPGNVFEPGAGLEGVHGQWGRLWLQGVGVLAAGAGAVSAAGVARRSRR
jgi:NAD(P)-dependent dehydrogenase (short-subunit alcohol dehydrogenase family)